jgi:hypothetical protein
VYEPQWVFLNDLALMARLIGSNSFSLLDNVDLFFAREHALSGCHVSCTRARQIFGEGATNQCLAHLTWSSSTVHFGDTAV